MTRITLVLAFVVALAGCKKEKPAPKYEFRSDWKLLIEIRNAMCACKDPKCSSAVLARKTKWSAEIATRSYKPSAVQLADADKMIAEIDTCMTKALRGEVEVVAPAKPAVPAKSAVPAAAPALATVEQLIALARDFAPSQHPQLVVASIDATFVDAEGKLDDQTGSLSIVLGSALPADDPGRRVGAPPKPRPAPPSECSKLTWTQSLGWDSKAHACIEASRPFPRCPVTEVWKRAIAKGAPADAVATLSLREATPRVWQFTIVDEPRKVKIEHPLPDDCELAVEKQ